MFVIDSATKGNAGALLDASHSEGVHLRYLQLLTLVKSPDYLRVKFSLYYDLIHSVHVGLLHRAFHLFEGQLPVDHIDTLPLGTYFSPTVSASVG